MGRFIQPRAMRGSQRWIQEAVNQHTSALEALILSALGGAKSISWKSPLASDDWAEYRDGAVLEKIGLKQLAADLASFWPARGPQWDALAVSDRNDILLVEAKAHIDELCSTATQASPASLQKIETALKQTSQ